MEKDVSVLWLVQAESVTAQGQERIETSRGQLAANSSRWAVSLAESNHLRLYQHGFNLPAGLVAD